MSDTCKCGHWQGDHEDVCKECGHIQYGECHKWKCGCSGYEEYEE